MKAETWVSSSALLTRMNFALALTSGKIKAVKVDVGQLAGSSPPNPPLDSTFALSKLESSLLDGDVSKQDARLDHGADRRSGDERRAAQATPPGREPRLPACCWARRSFREGSFWPLAVGS